MGRLGVPRIRKNKRPQKSFVLDVRVWNGRYRYGGIRHEREPKHETPMPLVLHRGHDDVPPYIEVHPPHFSTTRPSSQPTPRTLPPTRLPHHL